MVMGNYNVSNFILAPPGPPQNFEAKIFSDTEIYLTWTMLLPIYIPVEYVICYNAVTPVCVGGPVSVVHMT